jgi:hypothetical protein
VTNRDEVISPRRPSRFLLHVSEIFVYGLANAEACSTGVEQVPKRRGANDCGVLDCGGVYGDPDREVGLTSEPGSCRAASARCFVAQSIVLELTPR